MAKQKLIYKLVFLAIVPVIFSITVYGSVSYVIYKEQLIKERTEEAISLVDLSSEEIKNPLYFLQLNKLNDIIRNIKKNPNVLSVYIMDADGKVITDGTPENKFYGQIMKDDFSENSVISNKTSVEVKEEILRIAAPVMLSERIGTISIDFSLKELNEVLRNLIILLGLVGTILCVIIVATGIFVSSSISKPIIKLRNAADEIAKGNFGYRTDIRSGNEIGELAASFNKMALDLQKSSDERRRTEEKIIRLNRLYSVLSNTNQAIVRTRDQQKLFEEACHIAVKHGLFRMAWIGMLDPDTHELRSIAQNGFVEGYQNNIQIPVNDFSEKKYFVCNHRSFAAFPLRVGRNVTGTFNVYADDSFFFDDDEIHLLDELSTDISFALESIEQEKQRERAEKALYESLAEKEVLLREIYHRVKNNMQIISSLLKLQSGYVKEEKYREMFKESQNRIMSMSLVHEILYRSKDLAQIDFNNYIRELTKGLLQSYGTGSIKLRINVENISLGIDYAIPCGLIINELVTNSLKHAFPQGREGEIKISLISTGENIIELTVSDNGVGFPKDLDFRKANTLGLRLVTILAENQLHGETILDLSSGTEFKIKFKKVK